MGGAISSSMSLVCLYTEVKVKIISTRSCYILGWAVHLSVTMDTVLLHISAEAQLGVGGESLVTMTKFSRRTRFKAIS